MTLWRKAALGAGALVLVLATVVVVRTLMWTPPAVGGPVPLAASIPVDAERAALRLGEAIRFQTVSVQNRAETRWSEWDRLHAWMAATYPGVHRALRREVVAERTLIYVWEGTDRTAAPIVLMAHQDVVPVSPGTEGDWRRPPFGGEVADGYVFGRGALDDKGSLVAILEAAEALLGRGFKPSRDVYFVFGHDEEVSGTGAAEAARWFAARGLRPEFVLDEGGLILTENPISGGPVAVVNVAEKGYATLRVTARGQRGHSSVPPRETAVHVLAKAVDRIASDPFAVRFDGPAADLVRVLSAEAPFVQRMALANPWLFGSLLEAGLADEPVAAAMFHTTIAPTMLQGSPKENVLPQEAFALINYRLHPRDTPEAVMARAKRAVRGLDVELRWEGEPAGASPVSSTESAAFRLIATLAREVGGAPVAPSITTGATDSRWFGEVAQDVYRFLPATVTPDEFEGFHGTNERLSVRSLGQMIDFYARLIATAAG